MHEEGRRSRTRQRGGDLASDMSRLAHARNDNTASTVKHQLAGGHKIIIDLLGQCGNRAIFHLDDSQRQFAELLIMYLHVLPAISSGNRALIQEPSVDS